MRLSLVNVDLNHGLSLISNLTKSICVYYSLNANYHTNVKIIIDIPDTMLNKLNMAGKKQKCSRSAIIREAISAFLGRNSPYEDLNESFGLWKEKKQDGLDYQEQLREEWSPK